VRLPNGNAEDFEEQNNPTTVQVVAFIERMDFVYASADIIISERERHQCRN
jgi:UDP-N-acetylglucosamine:LPS N-acetylglucosamine transferase